LGVPIHLAPPRTGWISFASAACAGAAYRDIRDKYGYTTDRIPNHHGSGAGQRSHREQERGPRDFADDGALIVSELMTNAASSSMVLSNEVGIAVVVNGRHDDPSWWGR
jgi:hypothetical protein